ncbi:MAG: outer membrane beta-barrel protein [Planctomycetes bacterium]|nr:outer membrane beta-barrel protein [Planctomycetota bacterium]
MLLIAAALLANADCTPALAAIPGWDPREEQASPTPDERRSRLTFYFGVRSLDEDYWSPLHEPIALEASFEWRLPDSPFGFEVGSSIGFDESTLFGIDVSLLSFELYGGMRVTADLLEGRLRPYLGLGPTLIYADLSGESGGVTVSDDDVSFGLYARGGITWVFDGGFGVGLDYRKVFGTDVSLFGVEGDIDSDQVGLSLGFAF